MTQDELKAAIEAHAIWARGEGGRRANLAGANLRGANLARAYLARAYLAGADLRGANLRGANLARAYLARADLRGANLRGANLARAYLARAYLAGADLRGANLGGANLGNDRRAVGLIARVTRIEDPFEFFAWRTDKGDFIKAGCRFMFVEEYRAHIAAEYPDTAKANETLAILDFIEAGFKVVRP